MGRGTTRSVVEPPPSPPCRRRRWGGGPPRDPRRGGGVEAGSAVWHPSTILRLRLRMVPLPIRSANREETRTAHNPPIVSISFPANPLTSNAFPKLQRPQPAIAGPTPIIPPFRRREGRRALRSCRGGNGMSGREVEPSSPADRRGLRASSSEPPRGERQAPLTKGDGQGTRAVPGIGFARLRPARRRLRRQGVKSVAGPEEIQADSSRSDIPCGATSRSRNTSPTVSGLRARRSAGPSRTFRLTAGEGFSLRESARPRRVEKAEPSDRSPTRRSLKI